MGKPPSQGGEEARYETLPADGESCASSLCTAAPCRWCRCCPTCRLMECGRCPTCRLIECGCCPAWRLMRVRRSVIKPCWGDKSAHQARLVISSTIVTFQCAARRRLRNIDTKKYRNRYEHEQNRKRSQKQDFAIR